MCLRRQGAGGLLWRVATLGEPHRLLFVLTRPPMPSHSLAAAEKNEMLKSVKAQLLLRENGRREKGMVVQRKKGKNEVKQVSHKERGII